MKIRVFTIALVGVGVGFEAASTEAALPATNPTNARVNNAKRLGVIRFMGASSVEVSCWTPGTTSRRRWATIGARRLPGVCKR